jgi:hypothetical protein
MRKRITLLLPVILAAGLIVNFSMAAVQAETFSCTTSSQTGECGPYADRQIEGLGSGNQDNINVGNNMWNPISGASSTLRANNPGSWMVTANMPAGNTAVVSYPSLAADFHLQNSAGNWYEQPLTNFREMVSSFSETMNANRGTSAWAAYDIWLNGGNNEVMIQHDFAGNGPCNYETVQRFGGSDGVPAQLWGLCGFGSEQVWKLAAPRSVVGSTGTVNETSGRVNILQMLTWMEAHRYLPAKSTLGLLGYGWEMASTGGVQENFEVSSFSITTSGSSPRHHLPAAPLSVGYQLKVDRGIRGYKKAYDTLVYRGKGTGGKPIANVASRATQVIIALPAAGFYTVEERATGYAASTRLVAVS